MDSRSHNKLMKLKEWMKTQNVTDAQRAQLEALGAGDEVAGEEDDDEEEEDDEEDPSASRTCTATYMRTPPLLYLSLSA